MMPFHARGGPAQHDDVSPFLASAVYLAKRYNTGPTHAKAAGFSGARPRVTTAQNPNARPFRAMIFIAMVLFAGVVVIALISSGDRSATDQAVAPAAAQNVAAEPQTGTPAPSFPPLLFATSKRLPTGFHGIRLGSSVEEVITQDPGFDECGKGQPSLSKSDQSLCQETPEGFSVILSFLRGRLIDIIAIVSGISPEDADIFERNTLNQLGKPDVDVFAGPSRKNWVWIDGDLRLQYTSLHDPDGSRTVNMEMAVYPEMIDATEDGKNRFWTNDLWIKQLKRDWGEISEVPTAKPLPRGFGDIQLRMAPWQVRAALPGIEISTLSDHKATGNLGSSSGETSMDFWDGRAASIFRSWHVQPDQITQVRDQLIERFGMPSRCDPDAASLAWDDGSTEMTYMLHKGDPEAGEIDVWFSDDELSSIAEAANLAANPPKFKAAPETRSFF